ncbi:ATP-binding protein [Trinickia terrae]|uniref:ATP-binding protein n=1 Tax=Trinickia terrae TaxID=2571161 RepID=A0A4U1I3T5_9BURK|nr:ATP-binding protein [Trinickia terrae]TKC87908.1 ATP-binding protein [Trinickia terrae]
MPIIRELQFTSGPFESPLFISNPPEGHSGTWTSVFIGVNGSGKSLLLRGLVEFALGEDKILYKGRAPLILQGSVSGFSKVIALSGTPLDRFPRGGVPGFARKKPTRYDLAPYVYLGQRSPNGVVGAGQSERILAALMLRHARELNDRSEQLGAAFDRLGLAQCVGYRLIRPATLNVRGLRNHPISESALTKKLEQLRAALPELPYSPLPFEGEEQEVRAFVEWASGDGLPKLCKALSEISERHIAFSLAPDKHNPKALSTITEWRCVLALGLAELSGISFQSDDDTWIAGGDLSSGQWNWLTSVAGVALEAEDNSLILVDEPENSLHPEWQREFIQSLGAALKGRRSCHIVLATHSPLIASGIGEMEGSVALMSRRDQSSERGAIMFAKQVQQTFGWSASDVYEFYFGLLSTRAPGFSARADQALGLVREGIAGNAQQLEALVRVLKADVATFPPHDPMRSVVDAIEDVLPGRSETKSED